MTISLRKDYYGESQKLALELLKLFKVDTGHPVTALNLKLRYNQLPKLTVMYEPLEFDNTEVKNDV